MNPPNPSTLIGEKQDLPEVEQLGTITLEELHKYHCDNPTRRCLSMFGTVYDVTSGEKSYGPDGAYKEYAGHDITLALSNHKTQEQWLDRFVKMKPKWRDDAKRWDEYFAAKYPFAAASTSGTRTTKRGRSCRKKTWKRSRRGASSCDDLDGFNCPSESREGSAMVNRSKGFPLFSGVRR